MRKQFKLSFPSPDIPKNKVQVYGEYLGKIAEENGGQLKAEDVVEASKNRKSPLHNYFEWNNKKAGDKWRLTQARYLIRHINVVVRYNGKNTEVKQFFSVNSTPNGDENGNKNRVYITHERVLNEADLRKQIILEALNEAQLWRDRFYTYQELSRIVTAIKVTDKKLRKKLVIVQNRKRRK